MLAKINNINADRTKAKVKFVGVKNEDGVEIVSNWLPFAYPIFNDDMQIIYNFKVGDIVEIYNNNNYRFITFSPKYAKTSMKAEPNEVGIFFKNTDKISYNNLTQEITIKSEAKIKIEATGEVEIKGSLIKLN